MRITCVLGSPRKNGNGVAIANRFAKTAESLGAEVQVFALNELAFRGCQACMACKGKLDECALRDDLTPVLESLRRADAIVAATPVYMGYASGQFKCFMDRCYSFLVPDYRTNPDPSRLLAGKKGMLITTQGNPDPSMFSDLVNQLQWWIKRYFRVDDVPVIKGYGLSDESSLEPFLEEAEEAAKSICGQAQKNADARDR